MKTTTITCDRCGELGKVNSEAIEQSRYGISIWAQRNTNQEKFDYFDLCKKCYDKLVAEFNQKK